MSAASSLSKAFNRYASHFGKGVADVCVLVGSYRSRFAEKGVLGKAFSLAKIAAVPASFYFMRDESAVIQTLAGIGVALSFCSNRLQHNPHRNALSVPMFAVLGIEHFLMGKYGYTAMITVAALRNGTMASLSDDAKSQGFRTKLAMTLACLAAPYMIYNGVTQSAWGFAPLASMMLATLAASRIKAKSSHARLINLFANANNIVYSLVYSGSQSTAIAHGIAAAGNLTTALDKDVPDDGGALDKVKGYVHTLKTAGRDLG